MLFDLDNKPQGRSTLEKPRAPSSVRGQPAANAGWLVTAQLAAALNGRWIAKTTINKLAKSVGMHYTPPHGT